jgi:hypothetical protein
MSRLPPSVDEWGLAFHLHAAAPVEQVTIRRGGLYGRTGGLAEVVLRDAADVDRVVRTFHRAVRREPAARGAGNPVTA